MGFEHYDATALVPALRELGVTSSYRVCRGCVFTNVLPEHCFHRPEDFNTPPLQSDQFCGHCCMTIEENGEGFYLSDDKDLDAKVRELEEILELANSPPDI